MFRGSWKVDNLTEIRDWINTDRITTDTEKDTRADGFVAMRGCFMWKYIMQYKRYDYLKI